MKRSQSCFRMPASSLLALLVALAVDAQPAYALCADLEDATSATSTCVVLVHAGKRGMWFDLKTSQEILNARRLLPVLRSELEKYSEMDARRAKEVSALRAALASREAAADKLKAAAELSAQEARAAEESAVAAQRELDRWWRTPWVWLSVGVAAGAFATLAILH